MRCQTTVASTRSELSKSKMYRNHTIGVVVPAYSEEGFVGEVIETLPDYVDRIYVVGDCSTDGTWAEIRRHAVIMNDQVSLTDSEDEDSDRERRSNTVFDRRVVPIRHKENRGVGGRSRPAACAREDEIDITTVIAGDGQMDPNLLPRFLDPMIADGTVEYTKGNRLPSEEYRSEMPRFRLIGNAVLTVLTRIASGYWRMMDPQNGYTAIHSTRSRPLILNRCTSTTATVTTSS